MSDKSIVNIGELSRPATVLIEKISDAVGGIFKPFQIKRIAIAEAEAARVSAEGQIQISDLQRRAFYRFLKEEAKRQKSIEDITQRALPLLDDTSRPNEVEDDWIASFFDRCRLVSDEEMQALWSKVLAGEANAPGTFSKRTVNCLADLDKKDAILFTNLCSFGWTIGDFAPLVYDLEHAIYNTRGINFSALSHLESIGLIHFNYLAGFQRIHIPKTLVVSYHGTLIELEMEKGLDNSMQLGKVLLTTTGRELALICGSQLVNNFFDYVRAKWIELKYIGADKT